MAGLQNKLPGQYGYTQSGMPNYGAGYTPYGLPDPNYKPPTTPPTNPYNYVGEFKIGGQSAYLGTNNQIYDPITNKPYATLGGSGVITGLERTPYAGQIIGRYDPSTKTVTQTSQYGGQTGTYGAYTQPGASTTGGGWINGQPPPVTDPAAAGIPGTGTGGQFNYPMDPLADAASQPNIVAQNKLLEMMQTDPYLSGLLAPYLNQAYSAIGQSGMPTSSYTDQMLGNIIGPMYLANQQNVLGGYANLSPQLQGLAQTGQEPYQTLLNYILSF